MTDDRRAALAGADGWQILIIEATDLASLTAQADAFLAGLPPKRTE